MKPFNLEAAKAGAPVITRSGDAARIICFDRKHEDFPIVALLQLEDGTEEHVSYTNDGRYWEDSEPDDDDRDLFMGPVKKTGWFNLFRCDVGGKARVSADGPWPYATEEEAKAGLRPQTMHNYIGTFPLHYEE